MTTPEFSSEERERYHRHLILPDVGLEGQRKLKQARILIIGAGGLGASLGMYLAAAGIGTLGVVDFDTVDVSNLQRQIIHGTSDVGRLKVESARDRLHQINPHVKVEMYPVRLSSSNALELFREYDVIVDGTDNFPARYLINDACVLLGKPNVHGSIYRFEGQASVFWGQKGACYRCLYPEPPPPGLVPSCAEGGVLGVLPGIIGCIQANETIKLVIGRGESLINRLVLFDALGMTFRELAFHKNPACPVCGEHPTLTELIDYEAFCRSDPSPPQTQPGETMQELSVTELKRRLDLGDDLALIDVREAHEIRIAAIPGATPIPMGQIIDRQQELDPSRDVVVMCRSGGRSAKVIAELKQAGYQGPLFNLQGGILAWSDQIDPRVPKY